MQARLADFESTAPREPASIIADVQVTARAAIRDGAGHIEAPTTGGADRGGA